MVESSIAASALTFNRRATHANLCSVRHCGVGHGNRNDLAIKNGLVILSIVNKCASTRAVDLCKVLGPMQSVYLVDEA